MSVVEVTICALWIAAVSAAWYFTGKRYGLCKGLELADDCVCESNRLLDDALEVNEELRKSRRKIVEDYYLLLHNYARAYAILEEHDLLPGGDDDDAADEGAEGVS